MPSFLFFLRKFLFIGIESIDGSDECRAAPDGQCKLVRVEEVVQNAVYEIADESQCCAKDHDFGFLVLAAFVGRQAAVNGGDDQSQDE